MFFSSKKKRKFNTLRDAVKNGANLGHFGMDRSGSNRIFDWRLYGDKIEIKENKTGEKWLLISNGDVDHAFSNGIYGVSIDFSFPEKFLPYIEI